MSAKSASFQAAWDQILGRSKAVGEVRRDESDPERVGVTICPVDKDTEDILRQLFLGILPEEVIDDAVACAKEASFVLITSMAMNNAPVEVLMNSLTFMIAQMLGVGALLQKQVDESD